MNSSRLSLYSGYDSRCDLDTSLGSDWLLLVVLKLLTYTAYVLLKKLCCLFNFLFLCFIWAFELLLFEHLSYWKIVDLYVLCYGLYDIFTIRQHFESYNILPPSHLTWYFFFENFLCPFYIHNHFFFTHIKLFIFHFLYIFILKLTFFSPITHIS